jgi:protein-disulfide isomerase
MSTEPEVLSRRARRARERLERERPPRRRMPPRRGLTERLSSPMGLASIGAVAVGVLLIALAVATAPGPRHELVTPSTSYAGLTIDGDKLGSPDAPVVMAVYSDFQCPACRAFVTGQLPSLIAEFVRPGMLRIESHDIVILDTPGSSESLDLAAGAACAADRAAYWPFHDLVFWNQGRENRGDHDAAFIAAVAAAASLDPAALAECLGGSQTRADIVAATRAATAAGIQRTPTLEVNGQRIVGVPRYEDLRALISSLASPAPTAAAVAP